MKWILILFLPIVARATETIYVNQSTGSDTNSCAQVTNKSTPKKTINAGVSCVVPGGTIDISNGNYNELLLGQTSSSRACSSGDAAVQQPCAPIPNGLSVDQPTKLFASGDNVILSPIGKQLPGGGSAITLYDYARHIHVEGFRIIKNSAAGSTGGLYAGNAQYITFRNNELDDGQIKGGVTSRYFNVIGNHIHHMGRGCREPNEKPKPSTCIHGMYICGTDHSITDNYVHHGQYYGIQVSCEQGGIARIKLERNRAEHNWGPGIRCGGNDCTVVSNQLIGNGTGISISGSGVVANNTLHGYYDDPINNPDPGGIYVSYGDGSGFDILNNIITDSKNSYLAIWNAAGAAINTSKVHHNICSKEGNAGCAIVGSAETIYTSANTGDYSLLKARTNPAIGKGIPVPQVKSDIQGKPFHEVTPSIGAYALGLPEPTPEPPSDITALICTGELGAEGKITMRCVPEINK